MPQYQGVWTLQQQMQALTSGQWATDPLFDYTTLLLQADNAANSAQNNTFLDSSTNAFAITRNGNTTQGSFSPFSATGWSNFFDGTGDYLSLTGGVTDNGTGDLTLEFWSFYTGSYSTEAVAFDSRVSPFTNGFAVTIAATSGYWTMNFASQDILTAVPAARNTWQHVAVTRSGNTFRLFVDGVLRGTVSSSNNLTNNTNKIGASYNNGSAWSGYISNLRAIKGSIPTAYQTSSTTIGAVVFSPPAIPLTAVSGTSLLTCQANRFLDSSTNAFTITPTGDSSVQPFSPFAPQYQWTSDVIGGSGYFDGSGDYLVMTNASAAINPSTSTTPFTIECWVYNTGTSSTVLYGALGSENYGFVLGFGSSVGTYDSTQTPWFGNYTGSWNGIRSTTTIPRNAWTHLACVFTGSTSYLYQDGVMRASGGPSTWGVTGSSKVRIGCRVDATSDTFTGYISGARVVIGSNLYPSGTTFTPPTAPPTAITNTQLLTNFTNAGIYDGTMKNNLETVGNASVSTSVVKYGSGSLAFDGTGDWLQIPYTATSDFGLTSPFTIEFWVYASSINPRACLLSRNNGSTAAGSQFDINIETTGQLATNFYSGSSAIQPASATGVISTNTWIHVAITKDSLGSYRIFINGTQSGSTLTNTSSLNTPSLPILIGVTSSSGNNPFTGYLDDFRITKGIARYTQNFIPPSVALPRQ